jgi:hypothetical protein
MYNFDSSTSHGVPDLSTCLGIDDPGVLSAPVIRLHMTVLIIPFVNVAVGVEPSSPPSSAYWVFGPHTFSRGNADETLRGRYIGCRERPALYLPGFFNLHRRITAHSERNSLEPLKGYCAIAART